LILLVALFGWGVIFWPVGIVLGIILLAFFIALFLDAFRKKEKVATTIESPVSKPDQKDNNIEKDSGYGVADVDIDLEE